MTITLSLIAGPVVIPLQASADNDFLNYDNPNKGGNNPYKISLQGVITSGMLTNVVGCTGIVNKVSKVSTEFIQDLLKSKAEKVTRRLSKKVAKSADKLVQTATTIAETTIANGSAATGLPTSDLGAKNQQLIKKTSQEATKLLQESTEDISVEALNTELEKNKQKLMQANFREECLNGIAVTLAKNQLSAMTKHTMNWINSGFNGDPLFVRNVDSLMYSIENRILEEQTKWFKDPVNARDYPYGRDFAISAINSKQSADNFLDSMKSDLTSYLEPGATTESFANDFSEGGWSGWLALTQRSQNNPLGFMIEQSENLSQQQTTATQNTKEELARNGGVLDQRKCVEYEKPRISTPTRAQLTAGTSPAGAGITVSPTGVRTATTTTSIPSNTTASQPKCIRYEAVTPGSIIKSKIDTYVNSPERQLELARTINDALNALFSALIYKFQNQGLSSLSSSVNNYSGTATAGFGVNQVIDSNGNSILVQAGGGGTSGTGDGYIDLTKDLGNTYVNGKVTKKGILQIEHDYIKSAKDSVVVLEKVTPAVGKLDYCIPGPNPSWKANSLDAIDAYLTSLDGSTTPAIDPSAIESQLTQYEAEVEALYGPSSPMQTFASGSYLGMADQGLAITKDLATTAEAVKEAGDSYKDTITEGNANMTKLNTIKDKVNVIIAAAQKRRTTERATLGLTAMPASCLANEKVTYLDNGVRR